MTMEATNVCKSFRSPHGSILRGASIITFGSLSGQAIRMVNAAILGQILGPAQFGLASTLLLLVAFVEMSTSVNVDQQLVQAEDGDSPQFLAVSHAFGAVRGLVASVLLLALAYPVSWIFGIPEHAWAFAMLAITPICTGFSHYDRKRVQRHLRFAPDISVEFIAQVGGLIVGMLVAWRTRHFTAAMWAIVTSAFIALVASFCVAERPYRWAWDTSTARRLIHFGWPLLASNVLLFVIMQGERALLASAPKLFPEGQYTATDLGLFAAAGALAYAPMIVIGRLGSSMSLPLLASVKDNEELFRHMFRRISAFLALCALVDIVFFSITSPLLLRIVFGAAYRDAAPILLFLAIAQAVRMVRIGPTVGALALGYSRNTLWANIARAFGIGISLWVLASGCSVVWLAASTVVAELLSLIIAVLCFRGLAMPGRRESLELE